MVGGGWRDFLEKMTGQVMTGSLISMPFLSLSFPPKSPPQASVGLRTHTKWWLKAHAGARMDLQAWLC